MWVRTTAGMEASCFHLRGLALPATQDARDEAMWILVRVGHREGGGGGEGLILSRYKKTARAAQGGFIPLPLCCACSVAALHCARLASSSTRGFRHPGHRVTGSPRSPTSPNTPPSSPPSAPTASSSIKSIPLFLPRSPAPPPSSSSAPPPSPPPPFPSRAPSPGASCTQAESFYLAPPCSKPHPLYSELTGGGAVGGP